MSVSSTIIHYVRSYSALYGNQQLYGKQHLCIVSVKRHNGDSGLMTHSSMTLPLTSIEQCESQYVPSAISQVLETSTQLSDMEHRQLELSQCISLEDD